MKKNYNTLMQNSVVLLFLSLLMGGCAMPSPTIDTGPNAEVTFDGLHEIQNSTADKAWAMPGVDLSNYTKITLQSAGIEYRPGGESGRTFIARSRGGPYEVTEEQKARLSELAGEVFIEELGKSERFALVNEAGPDVLVVRAALLDVVSYVPPETTGRSDVYLSTVAEATLVLELRDSITDTILIRAIDRDLAEDMSGMMSESNRVTNTAEVRRLIRGWMSTLRERLDSFNGYSSAAAE